MWLLECDLPKSLLPLCHQWKRVVKCSQESHNHNNYMVGCDTAGVSHCWKGTQQTPPKEQLYSTAGDRAQLPHTGQTSSWWGLTGSDWTQYLLFVFFYHILKCIMSAKYRNIALQNITFLLHNYTYSVYSQYIQPCLTWANETCIIILCQLTTICRVK